MEIRTGAEVRWRSKPLPAAGFTEENGQGLGLSLASELARAQGGDVALVRSEGGWTEFAVTIPKAVPPAAHA